MVGVSWVTNSVVDIAKGIKILLSSWPFDINPWRLQPWKPCTSNSGTTLGLTYMAIHREVFSGWISRACFWRIGSDYCSAWSTKDTLPRSPAHGGLTTAESLCSGVGGFKKAGSLQAIDHLGCVWAFDIKRAGWSGRENGRVNYTNRANQLHPVAPDFRHQPVAPGCTRHEASKGDSYSKIADS